jgi:hypothetical protein
MDTERGNLINKSIKEDDNDIELIIIWDKYNSGLLCRKTFTWVDYNKV